MNFRINYTDGRTDSAETYDAAIEIIRAEYGQGAVTEHDGDLTERGDRTLCWADEGSSLNDDGANAVASIHAMA